MAPPKPWLPPSPPIARLPLKVELVTVSVARFQQQIAPPWPLSALPTLLLCATLLEKTSLARFRVALLLKIPPPRPELGDRPFSIVRPAMVTTTVVSFWLMSK